jgi:anti-sigma factor RsiW
MNEHAEIRELLSLAAAGALRREEEERVARHIHECAECTAEFENWQSLAAGLRRLPTPQPPAGLVERTRARTAWQLAAEGEQRWNHGVLIFLVLFGWTLTLASWPVVRLVSGGLLGWLDPGFEHTWIGLVGYTALVWVTGGVAAAMLALRRRRERRLA